VDTITQAAKYSVVTVLMVPMLGMALLVGLVSKNVGWRIIRIWSRVALRIFSVEVEFQFNGDPSQLQQGGILIGLNQQSLLDPTVGYSTWERPVFSIWNIEYALIPFIGWITVLLGWIIIRQNPQQAKRQLRKAAQFAANGGLVYLSAEGQRSRDGSLSPYKKGPFVLGIESQCLIHPMYLAGSRQCLPPGEWKIRPGKIVIRYLPPIATLGMTYDDRDALLKKVRAIGEAEHNSWNNVSKSVS
jgi:1-acyl-sn-glycerol-3-phosphate acyltransferase